MLLAVLGILSIAGLLLTWKSSKFSKGVSAIVLVFSLAGIGLASWTGYLGGQIRHTEIGKAPAQDAREGKDND